MKKIANEQRLIDANAVEAKIEKSFSKLIAKQNRPDLAAALSYVGDLIVKAPTVDAVEVVVHGKARELDVEEWYCCPWECQECGCLMMVRIETGSFIYPYDDIAPVFCAKCGAKMDGGNEDG